MCRNRYRPYAFHLMMSFVYGLCLLLCSVLWILSFMYDYDMIIFLRCGKVPPM